MASPGFWYRFAAWAGCLLALLGPPRVAALAGARPAAITVVAAYAVSDIYYHAWLNGQVNTPPPVRSFPLGTDTVAYYVSFRESVPEGTNTDARLYNARGVLPRTNTPLFGTVCKRHACMDSITMTSALAGGDYRIEVRLKGAMLAHIGFTVGHAGPAAPSGYRVLAFYTTTTAEAAAAFNANREPSRTAAFPPGTDSLVYYVSVKGKVAHTRCQVVLSIPGPGVIYTSKPSPLLSRNISVGANEDYTATTSDTLTLHPAFPSGTSRLDLLLDGEKAATTTFTIRGS